MHSNMSNILESNERLLIVVDWFAPAIRAGGPITSCVNLTQLLSPSVQISILTGCRDIHADHDLPGVDIGKWNRWKEAADVWYASPFQHRFGAFLKAYRQTKPTTIYLNSMFSVFGTIFPLLTTPLLGKTKIVLAPRGMLKPTALAFHRWRKKPWLQFLRWSGLANRIQWHSTSDTETEEIRHYFGPNARIETVPNIPRIPLDQFCPIIKKPKDLRLSFVGRVHPIKSLHIVLELLQHVGGETHLDVVGPIEDPNYAQRCQELINHLPRNIHVSLHGTLSAEDTSRIVCRSHALVLPSQGENFGHAIFEALGCGVPVLISDQTYWTNLLAQNAGWDLPLQRQDLFADALNQLVDMDQQDLNVLKQGAHQLALSFFQKNQLQSRYMKLFFDID